MKKVLVMLLAISMCLSFVACGSPAPASSAASSAGSGASSEAPSSSEPAPQAEVTTYKVGVAIYQFDDNFMTLYRNELESYLEGLSTDTVKYEVEVVDGKNDMATQSQQIDTFITQGVDLIICNPVQTSSADTLINKVVSADIPMVIINREPLAYDANGDPIDEAYEGITNNPAVCYVGADARQSGTYQGEIVLELDDKGDINGDGVISYIMIIGDPENPDAQYRTEYSIKALTDAGMEVDCLVENIGNWATDQGQTIAANALAQYADKIEVVFCNNDGMALGAAAAIKAAGRTVGEDIYLLGVDALEECQQMVQSGEMTGTVLNDHIGQSHTAADVAVKLLAGESIDNYYWVDYLKVNTAYFG